MHKSHIHACLGKGRPHLFPAHRNRVFVHSCHQFHTSPLTTQDAGQATATREQRERPISRSQRLRDATASMESLYHQHAASNKRGPNHSPVQFRSVPLRNASEDAIQSSSNSSTPFLGGSPGVPLDKAMLEIRRYPSGTRRNQDDTTEAQTVRNDMVDMKSIMRDKTNTRKSDYRLGERGGFKGVKNEEKEAQSPNENSLRFRRVVLEREETRPNKGTSPVNTSDSGIVGARSQRSASSPSRSVGSVPRETIGLQQRQRFPPRREGTFENNSGRTRPEERHQLDQRPENDSRGESKSASGYLGRSPRRELGSPSGDSNNDSYDRRERHEFFTPDEERYGSDQSARQNGSEDRPSRFIKDAPRRTSAFRNNQPINENGIQERAPRREGQGRPSFGRVAVGSGAPKRSGRPGRPRAARDGDDAEPRKRKGNNFKRTRGGGGDRDAGSGFSVPVWNDEEKEYFKQKEAAEAQKTLPFNPEDVSVNTYTGVGPALVSGIHGMSEVLGERLLLAQKYLDGGFIQWDSKEQRADVMTLVERLKIKEEEVKHDKPAGNNNSLPSITEAQTQELMQKLLGGKYTMVKPRPGKDILGNVAMHVDRNESYFPADQESLLEKVRSILPAEGVKPRGSNAKQAV